jgi:zinc D-Ala-D-Ala dipeptidase
MINLQHEISFLKNHSEAVEATNCQYWTVKNAYYDMGVDSSLPKMFVRKSVLLRLKEAAEKLPNGYKIVLLDGFRPIKLQQGLFDYYHNIWENTLNSRELAYLHVAKYFVDPRTLSKGHISPHNSGGAIDLTLSKDEIILDMGSDFDEMSKKSETSFYDANVDSSSDARIYAERRLILKNAMLSSGFTNYDEEWWHYDLGSIFWAKHFGSSWFYDSLENEVIKAMK